MKLIDIWDIEQNFWKLNLQLKLAFKDIYDADKSKDKVVSSKLMWAVALFIDPKSKFKDLQASGREELITKDYNKDFSVEKCKEIIDRWKQFLSPAERQLIQLERILDERSVYIEGLKYNSESGDEIDKRVKATRGLFEELSRLKDMIAEEEQDGIVKGGSQESLSERGEI